MQLPGKREDGAVRDSGPSSARPSATLVRSCRSAGRGRPGCGRRHDVASPSVPPRDPLMHPGRRQDAPTRRIPHLAFPNVSIDTGCKPLPTSFTDGARLKELMARLGHSSTRAALIYQHAPGTATRHRGALGGLVQQVRLSSPRRASKTRKAARLWPFVARACPNTVG